MISHFAGGSHRERCSVPGCGKVTSLTCAFALGGRRTGQQCGLVVCEEHSGLVEKRRICRAHLDVMGRRAGR